MMRTFVGQMPSSAPFQQEMYAPQGRAVSEWDVPKSVKEVRAFLGLAG